MFPSFETLQPLLIAARDEDLGDDDVTSRLTIASDAVGTASLVQKSAGVISGLPLVQMICNIYDPQITCQPLGDGTLESLEGAFDDGSGRVLLHLHGPLRSLLAAERVVLNFLQHLSGIATQTHKYVAEIKGTRARIYDTRKTVPGLRVLEKYAVRCGGGANHRIGLFDAVLIKDNHIAGVALDQLSRFLSDVVRRSRAEDVQRLIEVEVDNLQQLQQVLDVDGIDILLLDNMDCQSLSKAVSMRAAAGKADQLEFEASGGVNLVTVRAIAETGVERISIGAITHSAPALDIGMDVEPA